MNEEPKREYRTFTLHSKDEGIDAQVEYRSDMFVLKYQNEQGKPIIVTLREKQEAFEDRLFSEEL